MMDDSMNMNGLAADTDDLKNVEDFLGDKEEFGYDAACEAMRERNEEYLVRFEQWLADQGLKDSTIKKHISNVDFYINTYLLYYDINEMEAGCYLVGGFLGDFFIRKCMWSTPSSIKSNAASFKKFYKCMLEAGLIAKESYDALVAIIKEDMDEWQAECEEFDNPDHSLFDDEYDDGDPFGDYNASAKSLGLGERLGVGLGGLHVDDILRLILSESAQAGELLSREEAIASLQLALFYLTAWEERQGFEIDGKPVSAWRAWKSADWNALDYLREQEFIYCSNKAKSVTITEAGMRHAEEVLASLGLDYLL